MRISNDEVTYVAKLARLEFDAGETDKMAGELAAVLDYIDTLNEVDTTDVAPTEHILPVKNVFRKDEIGKPLPNDVALANAPDTENGCFKVPRVLE